MNKHIVARNQAIADALRREWEKDQERAPGQAITHLTAMRELAFQNPGVLTILKQNSELHLLDF